MKFRNRCLILLFPFWMPCIATDAFPLDEKGRDTAYINFQNRKLLADEQKRRDTLESQVGEVTKWLQIPAQREDCIVTEKVSNACYISTAGFNSAVREYVSRNLEDFQKLKLLEGPENSRGIILDNLLRFAVVEQDFLNDAFMTSERPHWIARADSIENAQLTNKRRQIGDSALEIQYEKHFEKLFAEKVNKTFLLIGSTDSLLIQTMRDSLLVKSPKGGNRVSETKRFIFKGRKLSWMEFNLGSLPPELRLVADTLSLGQFSQCYTTVYGHFLLYHAEEKFIPRTSFESALPLLVPLALSSKSELSTNDSLISDYYRKFKDEFRTPDTGIFRFWLIPKLPKIGHTNGEQLEVPFNTLASDTLTFPSKIVADLKLPTSIRKKVLTSIDARKNSLLGPFHTDFGMVYYKYLGKHPGGHQISLKSARNEIMNRIGIESAEGKIASLVAKSRQKQQEKRTAALREMVISEYEGRIQSDSALDEIGKRVFSQAQLQEKKLEWIKEKVSINRKYFRN